MPEVQEPVLRTEQMHLERAGGKASSVKKTDTTHASQVQIGKVGGRWVEQLRCHGMTLQPEAHSVEVKGELHQKWFEARQHHSS